MPKTKSEFKENLAVTLQKTNVKLSGMNFKSFCLFVPISWLLKVLCGVFHLSDVVERCFDEQVFALHALTNKDERAGQTYGGHEMYAR